MADQITMPLDAASTEHLSVSAIGREQADARLAEVLAKLGVTGDAQ